jgi:ubiquinone/menaquinone biosynthesis C-methylase UbiE
MDGSTTTRPNHHHDHPGFSGITGVLAALTMTVGRGGHARLATALTGVGPEDVVVDVGCGPGAAVRRAAAAGAEVVGVDPAPVMLRTARLLTRDTRHVRYLEGRAESLPLPDASATVLWSIATVHHWPDIDGGLQEARRVLRPGGRLLAIERRAEMGARGLASHGWTPPQAEAFAATCRAAGFVEARVAEHDCGRRGALSVLATAP